MLLSFWLLLHIGLALAFLLSAGLGFSPSIDTNLMAMLPHSSSQKEAVEAEQLFAQHHNRNFIILTASGEFGLAKEGAEKLYEALKPHVAQASAPQAAEGEALFEELSLFIEENTLLEFSAFLHKYRYALLDAQTLALLEQGKAQSLAEEALGWAYGAFHVAGMEHIEADPFLLAERGMRHFLNSSLLTGGLSLREGVLSATFEGKHHVLLKGRLSEAGASISKGGGVREIYRQTEALEKAPPEGEGAVRFVFSGIPFHSFESANKAQREISLLSTITTLLLLLLFLWVFRSPLPALAIVFAAALSIATGLCASLLLLGSIHLLSLSFGISLIGLSVDYSMHFFVQRHGSGLESPAIGRLLFKGVSLCFLSSCICFLLFLFAPFGILRQFALFSAIGLLSSYLTTTGLFPCLIPSLRKGKKTNTAQTHFPMGFYAGGKKYFSAKTKKLLPLGLGLFCGVALLASHALGPGLHIKNDIRNLYAIPPKLLEHERVASAIMAYGTGNGFLVSGASLQELLENEELLLSALDKALEGGAFEGGFWGVSRFIPSIKTQKARHAAAAALLPLAPAQYEALGFSPQNAQLLEEEYAALATQHALPQNLAAPQGMAASSAAVPPWVAQLLSNLLLQPTAEGKAWHSMLLPLGKTQAGLSVSPKGLVAEYEWATAINKAEDISAELDKLTATIMGLLGVAFGLLVLGVALYYRHLLKTFKIMATPLFAALASLTVYALVGQPLSFFSVSGFILVLGLSLDFMFYLTEHPASGPKGFLTSLTVSLSYITTAISFGALLFSSFVPVYLLALAVFPGMSAAFIWAMSVKE
ncbi:MAG: hypothetical protein FWG75_08665 [Cystobacterineae bacterium]|nr:hypothetical protein [Cystobacterineae bacterium]